MNGPCQTHHEIRQIDGYVWSQFGAEPILSICVTYQAVEVFGQLKQIPSAFPHFSESGRTPLAKWVSSRIIENYSEFWVIVLIHPLLFYVIIMVELHWYYSICYTKIYLWSPLTFLSFKHQINNEYYNYWILILVTC